MTSKEQISEWFDRGVAAGATHLIVACDGFDLTDYPVYVAWPEKIREVYAKYNGPEMQRVHEVYALWLPKAEQLASSRALHLEDQP